MIKNVLSLFDGMSCGQIALNRIGIQYENYFASEIDKYAIKVTQHNYPNTIQLGSVIDVKGSELPKIDLLMGGSPCQSFSFAGKRNGMTTIDNIEITTLEQYLELKENKFEFHGQSYLFWEYVRLLKETNPKYFLLENVKMAKKWKDIITETLSVRPIEINSNLVSAQNRPRLYWSNIENVPQPIDRNIKLNDILDSGYSNMIKSRCLMESDSRPLKTEYKIFHRYQKFTTVIFKNEDHFKNCKYYYKNQLFLLDNDVYIGLRFLTRRERERLQTVPEGYTDFVGDNVAASLLGNGWTVDVIAHILKGIIQPYKTHNYF